PAADEFADGAVGTVPPAASLAHWQLPDHAVDEFMRTVVARQALLHDSVQAIEKAVAFHGLRERVVGDEVQAASSSGVEARLEAVVPTQTVVAHQLVQPAGELREGPGKLIARSRGIGVMRGAFESGQVPERVGEPLRAERLAGGAQQVIALVADG